MLNDRSTPLSLLETRRSGKPRDLIGPGPTAAEMERILTIAARIPDHGKLHPWRFVVVANPAVKAEMVSCVSREIETILTLIAGDQYGARVAEYLGLAPVPGAGERMH